MESKHVTVLEIDLKAVLHNLNYFKSKLHKDTKIMAVVKAFAYGSESIELSRFLESQKVDYLAVAYTHEGITLRKAGISIPILVLHPQSANISSLITHQLEPNIFSIKLLLDVIAALNKEKLSNYPVHIKFNTGLNRLGFNSTDIDELASTINESDTVKVVSIFSHIAASEDLNERAFTIQQIERFKQLSESLITRINKKPFSHMLNTSGVINYPEAQFNMVRLGIGLFGFGNDETETARLKNVMTLKSIISQIHHINKGETVGYNRAFKASSPLVSATIPIGHADGISRQLANGKGYVTINGEKAPIVGNVCMDMIMVDITDIPCNEGDEIIVFQNQQTVNEFAKNSNTIPYELLTAISQRVRRVIKN